MEDGSGAVVRLDPDPALHPSNELPGDVEAEACASDPARHVGIQTVELLEDPALLRKGNPEALVGDREAHVPTNGLEPHANVAAPRRILDRVVDDVGEHLAQLPSSAATRGSWSGSESSFTRIPSGR